MHRGHNHQVVALWARCLHRGLMDECSCPRHWEWQRGAVLAAIDCPGWEENLVKGIASGVIFEESVVQQPRRDSLHSGEHDAAPFTGKTNGVTAENLCIMYKALNRILTFCYRAAQ